MKSMRLVADLLTREANFDERRRPEFVQGIVTGTFSLRDACERYGVSSERVRDWLLSFRHAAHDAVDERVRHLLRSEGLEGLPTAAFSGSLDDIAIVDLIQTMDLTHKSAVITAFHEGRESRIWCVDGGIVDAESGELTSEAAVYRIMALRRGRVVADLCSVNRTRTIVASNDTAAARGRASHGRVQRRAPALRRRLVSARAKGGGPIIADASLRGAVEPRVSSLLQQPSRPRPARRRIGAKTRGVVVSVLLAAPVLLALRASLWTRAGDARREAAPKRVEAVLTPREALPPVVRSPSSVDRSRAAFDEHPGCHRRSANGSEYESWRCQRSKRQAGRTERLEGEEGFASSPCAAARN